MDSFFKVKSPNELTELLKPFIPVGTETIPIDDALGRILATDIKADEDLPGFARSAMDGFALKSRDTFGARESFPAFFSVVGEVAMGKTPSMVIKKGETVRISTGGMLPEGADAVLMIEFSHELDKTSIEAFKAVSPLENVIGPSDDIASGAVILPAGKKLLPHDLGALAGIGKMQLEVFRRPVVGIISTGDEIVPAHTKPEPGQIRDINSYTLKALCTKNGGKPVWFGICPDNFNEYRKILADAIEQCDMVWISGGSSVGVRDFTLDACQSINNFRLLAHGISIKPGKPTIIGAAGHKPVIGLPGQTASALVIAMVFLEPLLASISGDKSAWKKQHYSLEATLSRNVESLPGREDWIRVRLENHGEVVRAVPVFGKSGLISTLLDADGLIKIDINAEGLYEGDRVTVYLFN